MDKIELIKMFLKEKGLTWNGKIYENDITPARDEHFSKDKISVIPVTIPEKGITNEFELVISVDLLSFISYGIGFDTPSCFAVIDEYNDILDQNDLSNEWRLFCLKHKGLIYKMAVENYVEEQKQIASDNCHKETLRYINEIKKQTELKNSIFSLLDEVKQSIDTLYESLNN